ncbi:hypothetical protein BN12_2000007 [Nostocoides japonicum T1-X7]|uniref:Uncharacterized protein n=1 Tax=Nostocoides japonicum T1-X7 TaxID=1194083 RepID=A0A077M037_9MICO|nr:hypothetical protein BN12_2000007 [Tetrasphaera japonica T1-X7]
MLIGLASSTGGVSRVPPSDGTTAAGVGDAGRGAPSAGPVVGVAGTAVPHTSQNRAPSGSDSPHEGQVADEAPAGGCGV